MDWWVWVLVLVVLSVVVLSWLWSSGRPPEARDHHHGRQPGQEDFRPW